MAKKAQPYQSVSQFAEFNQLILPRPFDWRLIQEPSTGEIQGLSAFRGYSIATNGIIVALESERGDIVFGHLDYFVADQDDEPKTKSVATKQKTIKHKVSLEFY